MDMGIYVPIEIKEEYIDATIFPMYVDGCLDDFTRSEILSGQNACKCEKCASNLVKSSDNIENRTTKEESGMRISSRLVVGSVLNISYALSMREKQVVFQNGDKPELLENVRDIDFDDCTSTRCFGERRTCNGVYEKVRYSD